MTTSRKCVSQKWTGEGIWTIVTAVSSRSSYSWRLGAAWLVAGAPQTTHAGSVPIIPWKRLPPVRRERTVAAACMAPTSI